jgi:type IV pilus assembly protein PilB
MAYASFKDFCVKPATKLAGGDRYDKWESVWRLAHPELIALEAKKDQYYFATLWAKKDRYDKWESVWRPANPELTALEAWESAWRLANPELTVLEAKKDGVELLSEEEEVRLDFLLSELEAAKKNEPEPPSQEEIGRLSVLLNKLGEDAKKDGIEPLSQEEIGRLDFLLSELDECLREKASKQFDEWESAWRAEGAKKDGMEPPSQKEIGTLPEFLCKRSGKTEADFLARVAEAYDWQRIDLGDEKPTPEAWIRISSKVAKEHRVIPLSVDDGVLRVAMSNPFNTKLLNAVRFAAKGPVKFVLASSDEVEKSYEKYYGVGAETIDALDPGQGEEEEEEFDKEIDVNDADASIIKYVNQVIVKAHKSRATDIHFEPLEGELRIRLRIDGILHKIILPPSLHEHQDSLISRIKIMSDMNIAEKRMPQDGRINRKITGEEIDIRVSTVPTVYGESVSLRLLTRDSVLKGLNTLGMTEQIAKPIKKIIAKPHGIVLVTGPTGSGKSTSLYAFLNTINSIDKRIMTVEDPVEYEMKGINQVHVKADIGRTFAHVLRHFLRQDPDVIMVGEIRDKDTAEIAITAANTGHLVFSTLHTNDAPSAFTRLIDMGIESFLVADAIEAIMAQRLVRTICPECKTEQEVSKDYLLKVEFPSTQISTAKFWRGAGKDANCDACGERGYQGRTGIYELLQSSEAIQQLVIDSAAATLIGQQARREGMVSLREYGWNRALAGVTTIEEVLRVTQALDSGDEPKENF